MLAEIKAIIAELPTYGYRRVHALLRRDREQTGAPAVNVKRVYRVMKAHDLLLQRHSGAGIERRHDGRVAVDQTDTRWCSDGFEIGCDNGERVRIAFTLDCCDREAISWIATTGAIDSNDIRDLMVESVERRFGLVDKLPVPIEWLSDNGSPYTATDTRALAKLIGLVPLTTPVESPQSNGMAEAFVKTFKRDYAQVRPRPDAATVVEQRRLVRALQHGAPAQSAWLSIAARVPCLGEEWRDRSCGRRTAAIASQQTVHRRDRVSPSAARSAETRSVWLDASTAVDHR